MPPDSETPTKVYIVVYWKGVGTNDYGVLGAFSTREDAEAYASGPLPMGLTSDDIDPIEEFDLLGPVSTG